MGRRDTVAASEGAAVERANEERLCRAGASGRRGTEGAVKARAATADAVAADAPHPPPQATSRHLRVEAGAAPRSEYRVLGCPRVPGGRGEGEEGRHHSWGCQCQGRSR